MEASSASEALEARVEMLEDMVESLVGCVRELEAMIKDVRSKCTCQEQGSPGTAPSTPAAASLLQTMPLLSFAALAEIDALPPPPPPAELLMDSDDESDDEDAAATAAAGAAESEPPPPPPPAEEAAVEAAASAVAAAAAESAGAAPAGAESKGLSKNRPSIRLPAPPAAPPAAPSTASSAAAPKKGPGEKPKGPPPAVKPKPRPVSAALAEEEAAAAATGSKPKSTWTSPSGRPKQIDDEGASDAGEGSDSARRNSAPSNGGSRPSLKTSDSEAALVMQQDAPIYGTCFGYLMKMSAGKGLSKWKRRWFVIKDNGSVRYYKTAKESSSTDAPYHLVELSGYIIQVANDINKNFAFKAVSGGQRTYYFAAESESDRERWMKAMSTAAETLLASARGRTESKSRRVSRAGSVPKLEASDENIKAAVKAGHLMRQGRSKGSWTRLFFILKDDILYYYTQPHAMTALGAVFLPGLEVTITTDTDKPHAFTIMHPGTRSFTFCAESQAELDAWVDCIRKSIQSDC